MAKKIGLALGSGGARGLSEIGVMLWLKERGIDIFCISGTSFGAILGGALASGYTPEYLRDEADKIKLIDVIKYLKLSFSGKSVLDWHKVGDFLRERFGDRKIENLNMPFACVASDIDSGQEFVFKEGDLVQAVSASASIPGIFPPVEVGGRHLVDGELVNPVPLDIALELGADLVIGVNACRSVFTERIHHDPGRKSVVEKVDGWVRESVEKNPFKHIYGLSYKGAGKEGISSDKRRRNIIDVISDSLAIVSSRMLSFERLKSGPHFMIRPEVGSYQDFEFDKAEEIINIGYEETERKGRN